MTESTAPGGPPAAHLRAVADARLLREARFMPATFDAAASTVELVFTTGADVLRRDYWTGEAWIERLRVAPDAVDLSRLNAGAPVLDTHQAYELENVIGVVERAWIGDGEGRALVRFSPRADVAPILEDVRAGILRNISVGYSVEQWQETEPSATTARIREAVRWTPAEVSLVPIPADPGAQLRAGESAFTRGPMPHNQEARMPDAVDPSGAPAPAIVTDPAPPAPAQQRAAPAAQPRAATLAELQGLAQRAALDSDWIVGQLAAGATLDGARDAAIDAGAAQRTAPRPPAAQVTRDAGETQYRGMEGWLMHRCDPARYKLEGEATACRGMSLLDMARTCLELGGHSTRGRTGAEIARMALGLPVDGFAIRAGATSSDFPNLLANNQSKRLMQAYDQETRGFTTWARRRDLPDFKTARTVELGAAPAFRQVAEGGNIEFGVLGESGETWALARFARNMNLSYVAIVNDDLGGFDRIPQAVANAAINLEGGTIYGILAANANMADGTALFASTRTVNVTDPATGVVSSVTQSNTTTGALTVDNYAALRTLLLRMRDSTGQQMLTRPNVLIVPSELEAAALAFNSTIVVPSNVATTSVNPYRGTIQIDSSQFLTDSNDWFLTVAAGSGNECIEYGYEQGMNGPTMTSFVDQAQDGMTFSMRHSFGGKAVTFRTIGRSAN
jgi:hypothetical protein